MMPRWMCGIVLVWSVFGQAADWPQWMGPNRDDLWTETEIIDRFPDSGPQVLWRVPIHGGYAGPAVANGKVYVADYLKTEGDDTPDPSRRNELKGRERILCLDAKTGLELWKHEYECPYQVSYPAGPRCTPTVDGSRVFTLGAMGHLRCLDANTGRLLWSKFLPKDYNAPVPMWGYAGHPLIYKDLLICTVGGPGSAVVAFNKSTGREVWKSLTVNDIGYSPPTLVQAGGTTQLMIFHGKGLHSLNPDTGKPYWNVPLETSYSMSIMAPRLAGDILLVGGYNNRSLGLKLDATRPAATTIWQGGRGKGLAPVSGTPYVEEGIAYGIDSDGMFRAVRVASGERLWETNLPVTGDEDRRAPEGACFVTKNGSRFFLFGESGDLVIARLTPQKYEEISRAKLLEPTSRGIGRMVVWSHPAYAQRCVFARNDKEIVCASLSSK